jgi:hypothetical protein
MLGAVYSYSIYRELPDRLRARMVDVGLTVAKGRT